MADQQEFSDDELLRLYKNPASDLSKLTSGELKRLDALTAAPKSKPVEFPRTYTTTAGTRQVPPISEDPDQAPTGIANTVNALKGMAQPQGAGDLLSIAGMTNVPAAANAVAKGAQAVAPSVGRALEATGDAAQAAARSRMGNLSAGGLFLHGLIQGDWKQALLGMTIPALVRGGGKMLSNAGQAIREGATAKAFMQHAESLPADIELIRESISKGMKPETAIRIVADGAAAYADKLRAAYQSSVKVAGVPVPEAVQKLLATPSFQRLPKP